MIVFHSASGLAALVAGLSMVHGDSGAVAVQCAKHCRHLQKPGHFVSLEHPQGEIICFRSGVKPQIVDNLFRTAGEVWGQEQLSAFHVQEGWMAKFRFFLFGIMPRQTWLIGRELKASGQESWR